MLKQEHKNILMYRSSKVSSSNDMSLPRHGNSSFECDECETSTEFFLFNVPGITALF